MEVIGLRQLKVGSAEKKSYPFYIPIRLKLYLLQVLGGKGNQL